MSFERRTFRSMGTVCSIAVSAREGELTWAGRALEAAEREVAACERALSRFDPESDLSRLNHGAGSWIEVDLRLVDALVAAVRLREETDGGYDPTILPALIAAGYDRSFELLDDREPAPLEGWQPGGRIAADPDTGRARVEDGSPVDLGGIGKGFAATRALLAMRAAWPELGGALADLGGDIAVTGEPPEGGPWRIDITDPRRAGRILGTLELTEGGVATSGRDTRRFGPAGQLHHLIDPSTGRPAATGPLAVTVVASDATEAEAHATSLGVAGIDAAADYLASRPALGALLVPQEGEPVVLGHLPFVPRRDSATFVITTQGGRFP